MKKVHYILFFLLSAAILSWVLPWLYSLCFGERDREPFVSYSPINDCFIVTDFMASKSDEPDIYEVDPVTQKPGRHFTMDERDSLLPEIFVGQLSAKGALPDSIKGVEITMRDIRMNSWIFTSSPKELNRSVATVYPLMESMPVRFKFEDPEVVMTLDGDLEITDIESNTIDELKTRRFAKMFADKGFAFPAKEAVGNITTRKGYDNGYLIIDNDNNLYHLKMQAGRPSMARIALSDTIVPRHVFVMENADRKHYGLLSDRDNNLYTVNHDDNYSISKLSGIKFDPEKDRMTIIKNLFSWCVKIKSGKESTWVALDPDDYSVLAVYNYTAPTSLSADIARWIFPFRISFTSPDDKYVYPRITDLSWRGVFTYIILIIILLLIIKPTIFMKKSINLLAALIAVFAISSCSNNKDSKPVDDEITDALTVDEIFESPEKYVGDTITIEGICSHLCAHGGRKAFIQGNADNIQIRCEAFPLMGEPFSQNTIHHPLKVTGVFCEERIDYNTVDEMERTHNERIQQIASELGDELAQKADNATSGCDTERAAQGQQDLNTFKERMDDYRKRIAAREAAEGKPYLQFYHIDAISYEIVE